jgi:brefeldin A-resistance guanine nucleotide exchange factor 1
VSADHTEWTKIFSQVLFPLITQLLRPEVYQSDPVGISEVRVRASTLLCRCYLHSLTELVEWVGFLDLWLNIVSVMDRLMNSGREDKSVRQRPSSSFPFHRHSLIAGHRVLTNVQEEVVAENFKNILLVMANGEYLAPLKAKPEQVELWNETWKRMEKFLPHLSGELFPEVETYGDGVHNHR